MLVNNMKGGVLKTASMSFFDCLIELEKLCHQNCLQPNTKGRDSMITTERSEILMSWNTYTKFIMDKVHVVGFISKMKYKNTGKELMLLLLLLF